MLKYDSALQAALNATTSKLDWCVTLLNMLGSDLKIRCKRAPDAASTTVFDTGVEFFSASISGIPQRSGSAIVKFGNIVNATIAQTADLVTGASVLRIEGNGHWIEGTLGLKNSACDFKVSQNPTSSTGLAFSTISISPPKNTTTTVNGTPTTVALPSGTGAAAPATNADTPAFIELEDWNDPAHPVSVKVIPLDRRVDDLVYQDAEVAAEIGDVRVTQSSQTIVYGQFEFGVTMLSINGALNLDNPGVPVHQVLVAHKPYGTWPSYPFADTFRPARDITHPKPYKIKIRRADMTLIKTIEMRDGLAINSPDLSQNWGLFPDQPAPLQTPKPLRPHMNCGQLHIWQSAKLKYSSNATKYCPGVITQDLRPTLAKAGLSTNASLAITGYTGQTNSYLQWYALPEWPIGDTNYNDSTVPNDVYDTFDDPYLFDPRQYNRYYGITCRVSGWNFEPGAIMGHDWYPGPGGPRNDRIALPTPLIRYLSDPNGVRLKGNVPNRTMLDAWNLGFFHHSHHWFTDVKNFTMLPKEYMRYGLASYSNAYYGAGGYVPVNRTVDLRGSTGGQSFPAGPRDGHRSIWNHWMVDDNHSYTDPYIGTIFCNSPAHTLSGSQRLHAHVMAQLGAVAPRSGAGGVFLLRQHAWRLLHLVNGWKAATTHSLGIDRETIEQRLQDELEGTYDAVYKPVVIDNEQSVWATGIRKFGMPMSVQYPYVTNPWKNQKWIGSASDSKSNYMNLVLVLMRQYGLWAVIRARSAKCAAVLDFFIDCLDKQSIDNLYYTKGLFENVFCMSPRVPSTFDANGIDTAPDPVMFDKWEDYLAYYVPAGQESLMTDVDGNPTRAYLGATMSLRFQWAYIRRDYFPEYAHPRLAAVITMIDKWNNDFEAKINAIVSPFSRGQSDLPYVWPPLGRLKPPTTLVPLN